MQILDIMNENALKGTDISEEGNRRTLTASPFARSTLTAFTLYGTKIQNGWTKLIQKRNKKPEKKE